MADNSLVSVVVPVYNGERYLAEALESVLAQTYRPLELIVVDDGSTDGSASAAKRFGLTACYFWQPHSGAGSARNRGVDLAKGSFLAFLDADDLWVETKLMLQMGAFAANPELDMVFGHVQQFPSPDLTERLRARLRYSAEAVPGYVPSAMMIKRDAFLRVGPFENHWEVGEPVDWYIRALEQGLKGSMLPEVVTRRRLHADNLGLRKRDWQGDYLRILKASLDRRRKSAAGPEKSPERNT